MTDSTHGISIYISLGDFGDKVVYTGQGSSAAEAKKRVLEMYETVSPGDVKRVALKSRKSLTEVKKDEDKLSF